MAVSISLDIKLDTNNTNSCKDIIDLLVQNDWSIQRENKTTLLPLNDDDMFNWTTIELTAEELRELINNKERAKELIGIEIYWGDMNIGGHLLLYNEKEISILLNINIQYIDKELKIPDYNWYVKRIIPALSQRYHIIEYNLGFTS